MNTQNEIEKTAENREAPNTPTRAEPFESEAASLQEASDSRETAERGYGWGV